MRWWKDVIDNSEQKNIENIFLELNFIDESGQGGVGWGGGGAT